MGRKLAVAVGSTEVQVAFQAVDIINALITIPADGIVFIHVLSGTFQTGVQFHFCLLYPEWLRVSEAFISSEVNGNTGAVSWLTI